jgi:hypothetical protein
MSTENRKPHDYSHLYSTECPVRPCKRLDELQKRMSQLEDVLKYMLDLVEDNLLVKDDLQIAYAKRLLAEGSDDMPF